MKDLRRRFGVALLVVLPFAAGCGRSENSFPDGDFSQREVFEHPANLAVLPYYAVGSRAFAQRASRDRVDLLLSIDNSASMADYIGAMQASIGSLVDELDRSDIDYRIGVIKNTEDADGSYRFGLRGPRSIVRRGESDAAAAVAANLGAVLGSYPGSVERGVPSIVAAVGDAENAPFFRPDSARAFILLSDAESLSSTDAAVSAFDALQKKQDGLAWILSAIGSPAAAPCPSAETPAQAYTEALAAMSGGAMGRICDANYAAQLTTAARSVATLLSEFSIASAIEDGWKVDDDAIAVTVDGTSIPPSDSSGFIWNRFKRTIRFTPDRVPAVGASVVVTYEHEIR